MTYYSMYLKKAVSMFVPSRVVVVVVVVVVAAAAACLKAAPH